MVVRSYALFGTGEPLHISDDQGSTWTTVPATGLAPVATVRDISVDPYNPYNSLICTQIQGIYKSTDGGSTYSLIPATNGIGWTKILHRDSLRVIAVGTQISHSYNGGNSFVNSGLNPVTMYGAYTAPVTQIYAYDVYFFNYNDGCMSIYDKLFKTTDGGLTWTVLNGNLPIVADDPITGISYNNGIINIVTGDGIYYSNDFGVSFSLSQSLGGTSSARNAMYTYEENFIYVIDVSGDIWKSGDTGLTWTNTGNIGLGALNSYKAVYAFSASSILVMFPGVSFNSEVFKSTDSGVTTTSELAPLTRGWALDSSKPTECGTCPAPKFTYNPINGYCEYSEPGIELCTVGYYYEPSNNTCVLIEDEEDNYPAPPCPTECPVIPGESGQGYCDCTFQFTIAPCCYELTDCQGSAESIITDADLSDYFDASNIIKINGSDICWEITKLDDGICPDAVTVIVSSVFTDCLTCDPSYALYNCKDAGVVIYTSEDLEASLAKTVQVSEYPGECWQVGPNTKAEFTPEEVTIASEFQSCAICNPPLYQLNNCFNDDSFIITDSDLLNLIGETVSIQGYPGLCFTVTEPTCQCLRVTGIFDIEAGTEETVDVTASTVLVNGRYQYLFTSNGNDYSIVWNNDPAQWEFYNITEDQLIAYNPIDTPCPYSGYWPQFAQPITYTYVLTDTGSATSGRQYVDVSLDNGISYQTYFEGVLTTAASGTVIRADQNRAGHVYVASDGSGIFYSLLFGIDWTQSGGTYDDTAHYRNLHVMYETAIPSLIAVGDKFAISTDGGLTYSNTTDTPATLYPTWPGPGTTTSFCVTSFGNVIYVGVEDKVFKTANNGVTWTACNADSPLSATQTVRAITALSSTVIIAVTYDGIYLSSDAGLTFAPQLTVTPSLTSSAIYNVDGSTIYVYFARTTGLVYKSTNAGISWSLVSSGSYGGSQIDAPFYDTQTGILGGRVISPYRTTNGGSTFTPTGSLSGKLVSIDYATYTQGCYPFCSLLIKTESCSDLIYDINVDQVFSDCECCTTKNCK